MIAPKHAIWATRLSWVVLGAALGACTGFGGYTALPRNADSFASIFALGFFGFFGWVGLLVGAMCGALIGGSCEALLRKLGVGNVACLTVATLINAFALWQIGVAVETRFPGLRPSPRAESIESKRPPATAQPVQPPRRDTCAGPAPTDAKALAQWKLECQ